MKEQEEIRTYLGQIIRKTQAGEIPWNLFNPSTYVWKSRSLDSPNMRLSIQKVSEPLTPRRPRYILQLLLDDSSRRQGKQLLLLDSERDVELGIDLSTIFREAETYEKRQGINALRQMLHNAGLT